MPGTLSSTSTHCSGENRNETAEPYLSLEIKKPPDGGLLKMVGVMKRHLTPGNC
jgi:hypothetical protein